MRLAPAFAILLALSAASAHAQQTAPAAPAPAAAPAPQSATAIPADLQARIDAAEQRDYHAARMALATAPDFSGYALAVKERSLMEQWYALVDDPTSTLEAKESLAKRLADELPLSYPANNALAMWYAQRHEAASPPDPLLLERGRPHFIASEGIIASITARGDGRSMETAWQVIHIGEEYLTLAYLDYEAGDQSLVFGLDDRAFDVFEVTDAEGKKRTVYFDVSAFFGKGVD